MRKNEKKFGRYTHSIKPIGAYLLKSKIHDPTEIRFSGCFSAFKIIFGVDFLFSATKKIKSFGCNNNKY